MLLPEFPEDVLLHLLKLLDATSLARLRLAYKPLVTSTRDRIAQYSANGRVHLMIFLLLLIRTRVVRSTLPPLILARLTEHLTYADHVKQELAGTFERLGHLLTLQIQHAHPNLLRKHGHPSGVGIALLREVSRSAQLCGLLGLPASDTSPFGQKRDWDEFVMDMIQPLLAECIMGQVNCSPLQTHVHPVDLIGIPDLPATEDGLLLLSWLEDAFFRFDANFTPTMDRPLRPLNQWEAAWPRSPPSPKDYGFRIIIAEDFALESMSGALTSHFRGYALPVH